VKREEPFRRIQRYEASIALGNEELRSPPSCEAAQRTAEERVCTPSEQLCRLADELGGADESARCTQAKDACTGARERARMACHDAGASRAR
jgi:hypothetical protein